MKWEAICYCFTWSAIADIAHPNTSLTRYTPCEFGLVTAKFCGVLATSGPAVCGWGQVSTALNCESGIALSNDGFAITFAWKDILGSCGTSAVFILLTRKCSEPFKWLTLKRKSRQGDCPGGHWIPWKQLQCNQWRPWQSPWRLFRLWYTCNSNESYNSLLASLLFIGAGQPLWCRSCRRWLHWLHWLPSLCHSMYDKYLIVIKIFDLTRLWLDWWCHVPTCIFDEKITPILLLCTLHNNLHNIGLGSIDFLLPLSATAHCEGRAYTSLTYTGIRYTNSIAGRLNSVVQGYKWIV